MWKGEGEKQMGALSLVYQSNGVPTYMKDVWNRSKGGNQRLSQPRPNEDTGRGTEREGKCWMKRKPTKRIYEGLKLKDHCWDSPETIWSLISLQRRLRCQLRATTDILIRNPGEKGRGKEANWKPGALGRHLQREGEIRNERGARDHDLGMSKVQWRQTCTC